MASLVGFALVMFVLTSQIFAYLGKWVMDAASMGEATGVEYMHAQWLMGFYNFIATAAIYLPPILLLLKFGKQTGFRLKTNRSRVPIAILLPLFIGLMVVINAVGNLLRSIAGAIAGTNSNAVSTMPQDIVSVIVYFITSCVLAAVFEEVLFRGCIQAMLEGFGLKLSIIVTSLIFTVLHNNLLEILTIFVLSTALGYVREISNSVRPCIVLHFVNNVFSFIMRMVSERMQTMAAFALTFWLVIAAILLFSGAIAVVKYYKLWGKLKIPSRSRGEYSGKEKEHKIYRVPVFLLGVFVVLVQFVWQIIM